MSMFGSIMSKIFGHAEAAAPPAATTPAAASADAPQAGPAAAPAGPQVDVGAVLSQMAAGHGERLNYQTSIVDLLKLLGLDSSLDARKTLAGELHYTGSTEDSAAMNIWLHQAVMQKLEENGGKVPADLKAA